MHTVECFPGGAAISVLHGVVHLNDIHVHVHIRSNGDTCIMSLTLDS